MRKRMHYMYYRFQYHYQGGIKMQEQVLLHLKQEQDPKGEGTYCYSIRHSCLRESDPVFLLSMVKPDVMDVLIFEIQRRYAEMIDEDVPTIITHDEVAGILFEEGLAESVADTHIPETIVGYRSFDLYDNWDIWDRSAEQIENLPVIQHYDWEKIQNMLYSIGVNKTV